MNFFFFFFEENSRRKRTVYLYKYILKGQNIFDEDNRSQMFILIVLGTVKHKRTKINIFHVQRNIRGNSKCRFRYSYEQKKNKKKRFCASWICNNIEKMVTLDVSTHKYNPMNGFIAHTKVKTKREQH